MRQEEGNARGWQNCKRTWIVQTNKAVHPKSLWSPHHKAVVMSVQKDKCVIESINVRPARAGVLIEVLLGSTVFVVAHALAGVQVVVLGLQAEWCKGSDFVSCTSIDTSTLIFIIFITSSNCTNSSSRVPHSSTGSTCDFNVGQGVNVGASASAEWVTPPYLRRFAEASRQGRLGVDALALADLLVPESSDLAVEAVGLILLDDEDEGRSFLISRDNNLEGVASASQLDWELVDLVHV